MTRTQTKTSKGKKSAKSGKSGEWTDEQKLKILEQIAKAERAERSFQGILTRNGIDDLRTIAAWRRALKSGKLVATQDQHPNLVWWKKAEGLKKARAAKKKSKKKAKGKTQAPAQVTAKADKAQVNQAATEALPSSIHDAVQALQSMTAMVGTVQECLGIIDEALGSA